MYVYVVEQAMSYRYGTITYLNRDNGTPISFCSLSLTAVVLCGRHRSRNTSHIIIYTEQPVYTYIYIYTFSRLLMLYIRRQIARVVPPRKIQSYTLVHYYYVTLSGQLFEDMECQYVRCGGLYGKVRETISHAVYI